MAEKIRSGKNSKSKKPSFSKNSKMRRYEIIYDEDLQQSRAGFFKKDLYKIKDNKKDADMYWTIEPGFEHRMDLISKKFYQTSKYAWVLEEINDIKDPIKDVIIGKKILILSQARIIALT